MAKGGRLPMSNHETKTVTVRDIEAEIDVEIAELIGSIWTAGIQTTNSCQENQPGLAWIDFPTAFDAADFLNAIAGEFDEVNDSLYNRIRREWEPTDASNIEWWQFDSSPWDSSVIQTFVGDNEIEELSSGPANFVFSVSIRFPRSDIGTVTRRMHRFNESKVGREYAATRLSLVKCRE